MSNFYVTTPIYYVNDKPHIGHSYTTILGDILARYHRAMGDDTFFLTGTDEHGQKVQKAAEARSLTPQEHCDDTVKRFQELWERLGISNDDFVRTTQERHKKVVRAILQDLFERDLIYKKEYKGHYCVPCERFFTDKDLVEGNLCPDCGRPTNEICETNYFFRMGQYRDWLVDYIQTHPGFILPDFRANETLGFLKKDLEDLCISRPKSRLSWGIELPFDPDYVCYVWFDALINYISTIGYRGEDEAKFAKYWQNCLHLIGKDILTTHTVYWPTMLHAMGLPMPKHIFAHGWWLTGNAKMSKSAGNVVNPMDMIGKFGVDSFRYCLTAGMVPGQDASFTEESFILRYNTDLANDLGNMLSRVVKMSFKYFEGKIPSCGAMEEPDKELLAEAEKAIPAVMEAVRNIKLDKGLDAVMNVMRAANRYMEKTAPWTLAKNGETERLATVLYTAAESLRIASALLLPVMPEKMKELRMALGFRAEDAVKADYETLAASRLTSGSAMVDIAPLFPRIMVEKEDACNKKQPKAAKQEKVPAPAAEKKAKEAEEVPAGMISVDDFFKTELKTAEVLEAEKVENSDKLLRMQIKVGEEVRQIVSGIAQYYTPEEMVGKTIVIVANLKPAKIRGVVSNGMLLAAKDGDTLKLVTIDGGSFKSGIPVG